MVETSILIGVIVGISELVKRLGLNPKFIPVLNLLLGVFFYVLLNNTEQLEIDVFNGIIVGLTASGLYSGTKNVLQGIMEDGE